MPQLYTTLPLSPVNEDYKPLDEVPLRRASLTPSQQRRRPLRGLFLPLSIAGNLLLFVGILFTLARPCYFSDRACRYDRAETAGAGAMEYEEENGSGTGLMGDLNLIVPTFDTEEVVFEEDLRYANRDMFSDVDEYDKVLAQWAEDMPIGRGFVQVRNSSFYPHLSRPWQMDFAPGLDGYSIASLHQLHCLYMILTHTGSLAFPERPMHHAHHSHHSDSGSDSSSAHDAHAAMAMDDEERRRRKRDDDDGDDMQRHVTHCYDYLRQSLRCAGDATLEGRSASVDGVTDGWGDAHVCKSNGQLWDWVVANRYSDKTGIS